MGIKSVQLDKPVVAICIFLLITLAFSYPLYSRMSNWGMHDWDQHFFYEGVPRQSIMEFQQFPLWNPYQCGGNVMLANPQSSFLSIHFPLTLLFGEVIAMKLAIMFYLFIGLLGMWYLCRKLGMAPLASYFPPILVMLAGVFAMRMTVGHTNWYHLAWIPWIFLCYLHAQKEKKYILPASFLLALIFLGGGIHPFVIAVLTVLTYAILDAVQEKEYRKILIPIAIILLAIPFAAIKLFPTAAVYSEMLPIEQTDIQPIPFSALLDSLTNRNSDITQVFYADDGSLWSWHEYYAYLGIIPFVLFAIAALRYRQDKEKRIFAIAAIVIFIFMMSQELLPTLWNLLYQLPLASLFHGPTRLLFAIIFFIALMAGFLATSWEKQQKTWLVAILLGFIVMDLIMVNGALFAKGLYIEPTVPQPTDEFYTVYAQNTEFFTEQYVTFLNNKGIWNCYERFYSANQGAIPKATFDGQLYADYLGESYIAETAAEQAITFFSPNKIIVEAANAGTLVLNQNYVGGWHAIVNNEKQETFSYNGAIATTITEASTVTFFYRPAAFILGAFITIATIAASVYFFVRTKRKQE